MNAVSAMIRLPWDIGRVVRRPRPFEPKPDSSQASFASLAAGTVIRTLIVGVGGSVIAGNRIGPVGLSISGRVTGTGGNLIGVACSLSGVSRRSAGRGTITLWSKAGGGCSKQMTEGDRSARFLFVDDIADTRVSVHAGSGRPMFFSIGCEKSECVEASGRRFASSGTIDGLRCLLDRRSRKYCLASTATVLHDRIRLLEDPGYFAWQRLMVRRNPRLDRVLDMTRADENLTWVVRAVVVSFAALKIMPKCQWMREKKGNVFMKERKKEGRKEGKERSSSVPRTISSANQEHSISPAISNVSDTPHVLAQASTVG